MALPIVYSGVAIKCGSPAGGGEDSADDRYECLEVASNLGLVVSAGCLPAVKQVHIDVYYAASPFPGLGAVAQLMRGAAEVWTGVRELEVLLNPYGSAPDEHVTAAADYEESIRQASDALFAIMPGVRRMIIDHY